MGERSQLSELSPGEGGRPLSQVPDAFERWELLEDALADRHLAVLLDMDGTLAPIVDDPDAATVPAETREVVEQLTRTCVVAIISGRDLRDLRARVEVTGLWYAGSHGFELEGPDGEHHEQPEVGELLPALDDAEQQLHDDLEDVPDVMVERKRFAVAVHTRGADERTARRAVDVVERVRGSVDGLRVTGGRAVTELRPDIDWDKGTAVRWLLDRLAEGDGDEVVPIYAGDDLTDEDALAAIQHDGLGVVVRNDEHGDRTTAAHVAVDGPDELRELLARLARLG
jgi:alpha,alpha-trehalase